MFRLDLGLERSFDRSQNLGPNCLNLWNPNLQSVTAHGLFGWVLGPNCLNLWNPNFQSVTAHGLFGWLIV